MHASQKTSASESGSIYFVALERVNPFSCSEIVGKLWPDEWPKECQLKRTVSNVGRSKSLFLSLCYVVRNFFETNVV